MKTAANLAIAMMITVIMALLLLIADQFYPALAIIAFFAFLAIKAENHRRKRNRELNMWMNHSLRGRLQELKDQCDLNSHETQTPE